MATLSWQAKRAPAGLTTATSSRVSSNSCSSISPRSIPSRERQTSSRPRTRSRPVTSGCSCSARISAARANLLPAAASSALVLTYRRAPQGGRRRNRTVPEMPLDVLACSCTRALRPRSLGTSLATRGMPEHLPRSSSPVLHPPPRGKPPRQTTGDNGETQTPEADSPAHYMYVSARAGRRPSSTDLAEATPFHCTLPASAPTVPHISQGEGHPEPIPPVAVAES